LLRSSSLIAPVLTTCHIHHTVIDDFACRPRFHESFAASATSLRRIAFASWRWRRLLRL